MPHRLMLVVSRVALKSQGRGYQEWVWLLLAYCKAPEFHSLDSKRRHWCHQRRQLRQHRMPNNDKLNSLQLSQNESSRKNFYMHLDISHNIKRIKPSSTRALLFSPQAFVQSNIYFQGDFDGWIGIVCTRMKQHPVQCICHESNNPAMELSVLRSTVKHF